MKDLKSVRVIWLKGVLFLILGLGSAALIIAEAPSFKQAAVLALTVWAFCRAYYFAFYVIEHYVDPSFRFSGLFSFLVYCLHRRREETDA